MSDAQAGATGRMVLAERMVLAALREVRERKLMAVSPLRVAMHDG